MSILASIVDQFNLQCTKDNEIGDHDDDLHRLVFDYYLTSEAVEHFSAAIDQLDGTPLEDNYQWLLFTGFNAAMDIGYYDHKHRDILCYCWLPKYLATLNKLIATEAEGDLPLNAIKYILSNLIRMQITRERIADHFMKQELQFHQLNAPEDYLALLKAALPLLTNTTIVQRLETDDHSRIEFRWDANSYANTSETTATFVVWLLLRVLLMFIKADGDCFTQVKHDSSIKAILLQANQLIPNQHPAKLSLHVLLALLINERDVENDASRMKDSFTFVLEQVKQIGYLNGETCTLVTNGVYDIDLLLALKAYLQYDHIRPVFIENDGLNLLIHLTNPLLAPAAISCTDNELFNELSRSLRDLTLEHESDADHSKTVDEIKASVQNGLHDLLREMALVALECLHVLSFDSEVKENLRQHEDFLSHLHELKSEHQLASTNRSLDRTINGLLWKLEREDAFRDEQRSQPTVKHDEFDLMISYSTEDSVLVSNIHRHLTEQLGLKVHFDEHPLPDSACRGIEESRCVLVCLSESYRSNPNCRTEAEYAESRDKRMVPLVIGEVEHDGWIGALCAERAYVDLTDEDFDKAVHLLRNEIGTHHVEESAPEVTVTSQEEVEVSTAPPESPPSDADDYTTLAIDSWTNQHVQRFLHDHKLDVMLLLTEEMNGDELQQLFERCQMEHDYWAMFERFNNELKQRFQQTLPISVYIRFLHQLHKYVHVSAF